MGHSLRFLCGSSHASCGESFTWIDYMVFFRADKIISGRRIWRDHEDNSVTVADHFARLPGAARSS